MARSRAASADRASIRAGRVSSACLSLKESFARDFAGADGRGVSGRGAFRSAGAARRALHLAGGPS